MKPGLEGVFPALAVNLVKWQMSPNLDLYWPPTSDEASEELLK